MGFGAAAIIVFGGFVNAIYWGVRESTIRSQVGHIQLYRKGYSERGNLAPFDYLVPDYAGLQAELAKLPHVRTVTARLGFSGLISTGDTTTAFVGTGVQPDGERDLSSLAVVVDGKDLASRDPRGITLGLGLARAFGVKPGDDLTLLTTTKGGAINALAVKVRGVWESGRRKPMTIASSACRSARSSACSTSRPARCSRSSSCSTPPRTRQSYAERSSG